MDFALPSVPAVYAQSDCPLKDFQLNHESETLSGLLIDFWDLVVISAIDAPQQQFYTQQIEEKLIRRALPRCTKYVCPVKWYTGTD